MDGTDGGNDNIKDAAIMIKSVPFRPNHPELFDFGGNEPLGKRWKCTSCLERIGMVIALLTIVDSLFEPTRGKWLKVERKAVITRKA